MRGTAGACRARATLDRAAAALLAGTLAGASLAAASLAGAAIALLPAPAFAAACTLREVAAADQAKIRVYFTRFQTEDKTGGKYKQCKVVKRATAGEETFFVTPFRQDANLIVHRSNWPG
jgi:hypothetical protein